METATAATIFDHQAAQGVTQRKIRGSSPPNVGYLNQILRLGGLTTARAGGVLLRDKLNADTIPNTARMKGRYAAITLMDGFICSP